MTEKRNPISLEGIVGTKQSIISQKIAKNLTLKVKLFNKGVAALRRKIILRRHDLLKATHNLKSKKSPYNYQKLAIENVVKGFENADRGQLIMPCGTGKTLISLWIQERLNPQYTLVLFPSLALLRQTKDEWSAHRTKHLPYMCVCSEKDIDAGNDNIQISLSEIGGNVSTESEVIQKFLAHHKQAIIFSTYQSLESVAQATKGTNLKFDLALCDEAHKTAGTQKGVYSLIHDDSIIPVSKRLYMTATPRIIGESAKRRLNKEEVSYVADMSDPKIFGQELHYMSFKEAIDQGILVDYQIVAIGVTDVKIQAFIKEGHVTKIGTKIEEIANNYALERFMDHYAASSVISFHSSIKKAVDFKNRHEEFFKEVSVFHVNGKQSTKERHGVLNEFAKISKSVVTNARCLTEGVDIPVVDAVFFCDPKNSKVDIVQAAGRTLRRADHRNKTMGYIVVPLFHRHEDDLESIIETGAFSNLLNVVRGLSNHDERITDVMRRFKYDNDEYGAVKSRNFTKNEFSIIEADGVTEHLKKRLFDQVIDNFKLPWIGFEDARSFVHSLALRSRDEWLEYCKSGKKPNDIPVGPQHVYINKGWESWTDWLGRDTVPAQVRQFKPFKEARIFARTLNLKYRIDWKQYARSPEKPDDIPVCPDIVYKNKGWISWIDWLGSDIIPFKNRKYLPFKKARSFVHTLGLKTQDEWRQYTKSIDKPNNIPADPGQMYKNKGWISMGDWLGSGTIAHQKKSYKTFMEARLYVHSLKLKSRKQWIECCKRGQILVDIPHSPGRVYKSKGWVSWPDWLGTKRIITSRKKQ